MLGGVAAGALVGSSLAFPAPAAFQPFGVRLPPEGLVVEVPYTFGTHREHIVAVDGFVRLDPDRLEFEGGRFVIPLTSFHSDDPKRGCHLKEALGLDYARSHFPGEHVCDGRNELPAVGPDAIAYPEIVLDFSAGPVSTGSPHVEVEGTLTVHGLERQVRLEFLVERVASPAGGLRVRGRVPLRLSDFGVVVKPAKVLFASIAVKDDVTVVVDALLEPLAPH
jgi:polyisoprenoid-binding protein YceI